MCTRCCCPCGPHTAKRVLVSRDVPFVLSAGRQDEEVIKSSWVHQMQRAKERPNLVHWRDELVSITKDSSEDFEDATLSVELMRVRCDVCYHEKSVSLEVDVTNLARVSYFRCAACDQTTVPRRTQARGLPGVGC